MYSHALLCIYITIGIRPKLYNRKAYISYAESRLTWDSRNRKKIKASSWTSICLVIRISISNFVYHTDLSNSEIFDHHMLASKKCQSHSYFIVINTKEVWTCCRKSVTRASELRFLFGNSGDKKKKRVLDKCPRVSKECRCRHLSNMDSPPYFKCMCSSWLYLHWLFWKFTCIFSIASTLFLYKWSILTQDTKDWVIPKPR